VPRGDVSTSARPGHNAGTVRHVTEPSAFAECEPDFKGRREDGLRQGDVLQLIHHDSAHDRDGYLGVVVTANCDLAFGKHDGLLTYVSVVPFAFYVAGVTIPRVIETELAQERKKLREQIEDQLLADRILEMVDLGSYTRQEILIRGSVDRLPSGVTRTLNKIFSGTDAVDTIRREADPGGAFKTLHNLSEQWDDIEGKQGRFLPRWRKDLIDRSTKRLPGDAMFFNLIVPRLTGGHIAQLRVLRSVDDSAVALSPIDERRSPQTFNARRVARLQTLYIHKLVQQMSQVFADIGLPVPYEEAREELLRHEIGAFIK
jgi:hypothetical protein